MKSAHRKKRAVLLTREGFTLVELMVTLVVTSILIAGVYSAYVAQQRLYQTQDQVAEMQQNLRVAVDIMARNIRMAGFPGHASKAGICTPEKDLDANNPCKTDVGSLLPGQISFTQDSNEDGKVEIGERMDFGFSYSIDALSDGVPDALTDGVPDASNFGMRTGAGPYQTIAENIQAVEFRYLDDNGVATSNPDDARSVQISILARAGEPDRKFTNTATYTRASGDTWGPYNDNYQRRLLITTIKFRNVGI